MPAYTVTTDLYTTDPLTNPLYAVTADHDYFAYLKEDPTFNIKIGFASPAYYHRRICIQAVRIFSLWRPQLE